MNREELLMRLRKENEDREPYETEVERRGMVLAAIVALVLTVLVFLAEFILHGRYNFGVFAILLAMYTTWMTVRAFGIKSIFNTVIAIILWVAFIIISVLYGVVVYNGWF